MEATFGAGCFWGVEETFRKIKGVLTTEAGYSGGGLENPTYKDVCAGKSGHTEVVHITYDPEQISYEELIGVFLNISNPSQKCQYRSVIFTHNDKQREIAESLANRYTDIEPAGPFYRAEEYHQCYYEKGL